MESLAAEEFEDILIAFVQRRWFGEQTVVRRVQGIRCPVDTEQLLGAVVERFELVPTHGPGLGQRRVLDLGKILLRPEVTGIEALERRSVQDRRTAGSTAERREEIDFAHARA